MPYAALAIVVLAVFYGIYFSKMLIQRRHGIKTHQIGSRKEGSVHTVEVLMSIATFGAPAAQLVSVAFGWSLMPAGARFTGFCTGMLGDLIFLVSVICMKVRASPTRTGPSLSRPAFTDTAATPHSSVLILCTSACCSCILTRSRLHFRCLRSLCCTSRYSRRKSSLSRCSATHI